MVVASLDTAFAISDRLRSVPFHTLARLVAVGWCCASVRAGDRYQPIFAPVPWPEVEERWQALAAVERPCPSLPVFVSFHWTPKALLDRSGLLGAWVTPCYTVRLPQLHWNLTLAFGNTNGAYPAALALGEAIAALSDGEVR